MLTFLISPFKIHSRICEELTIVPLILTGSITEASMPYFLHISIRLSAFADALFPK